MNGEVNEQQFTDETDTLKLTAFITVTNDTDADSGGPRFDGSITSGQRKAPSNGIWLCQCCAKLVDNDPLRFDVETLLELKHQAEKKARDELYQLTLAFGICTVGIAATGLTIVFAWKALAIILLVGAGLVLFVAVLVWFYFVVFGRRTVPSIATTLEQYLSAVIFGVIIGLAIFIITENISFAMLGANLGIPLGNHFGRLISGPPDDLR